MSQSLGDQEDEPAGPSARHATLAKLSPAERRLLEEQSFSDVMIESMPGILYFYDLSGRFLRWNRNFEDASGYSSEEIAEMHPLDFFRAEDRALVEARIAEVFIAGVSSVEAPFRSKDGRIVPYFFTGRSVVYADKPCLVGVGIDITERIAAEERLRESELKLRALFDQAPLGIAILDTATGRFLKVNHEYCVITGHSEEEMLHLDFQQITHPEDLQADLDNMAALQRGHSAAFHLEKRYVRKDGAIVWVRLTCVLLEARPGESRQHIAMVEDITEQKRADSQRAESERKYRELVELANSIILRWNEAGKITFLNEFGQRFFGYSEEEVIGRHVVGTIVPETTIDGGNLDGLMAQICANPEAFERNVNENIRRNGERAVIAWTNKIIRDDEDNSIEILSVGTDITEQQRAEEARRESEARYRTLFEYAPDGILIAGSDGVYIDANPSICAMLGMARDALIGKSGAEILAPSEAGKIDSALSTLQARRDHHREWLFRRHDGSVFPAEVIATTMPDGNIMAMVRDITERKIAEARLHELNETLESKVIQRTAELETAVARAESADRLKSAFLATMSHELRTPLNSIIGFTGIMLQGLAGPINDEQTKQLDMVRSSARHLLALINDVLDISKIEAGQLDVANAEFDPEEVISRVVSTVSPLAEKKGLTLKLERIVRIGKCLGDERRFGQVLLNLLSNAIKFTEAGQVTLRTDLLDGHRFDPQGAPRAAMRLRVIDTGIGIQPEDLGTLFQPFRQIDSGLSRNFEGTGLGLAICAKLVGLMGGEIHAESEWGRGSKFTVILPHGPRGNS